MLRSLSKLSRSPLISTFKATPSQTKHISAPLISHNLFFSRSIKFSSKRYVKEASEEPPKPSKSPSVPAMLAVMSLCLAGIIAYRQTKEFAEREELKKKELQEKVESSQTIVDTPKADSKKAEILPSERYTDQQIKDFPFKEKKIIFVLGGPGSGKGTNSSLLVQDFGFVHLSAGDLLRAEQKRPGSKVGELISTYIKEGQIVPYDITISLLRDAIMDNKDAVNFLIDGFPRSLEQARAFEESITDCQSVLYFECPEQVLFERILKRSETSGRADDNAESLKKRFGVFTNESYPVIEDYANKGKVKTISCIGQVEDVYSVTKSQVQPILSSSESK
ncbi:hypothetical protein BB559_002448 [Furculomyces boomerangus]|uniref:Uncharacterized protein n=2 Tax=Harpellales TaxID=61421 RepID=A0A2T9YGV0_9FUNG|nr:hypothetical protein BB559_004782 [Furculomyces boomerangus]PVU91504.1 hypothetical protein BB559_004090 [Furculomyces boomerangus]PVU96289.1 hypothetical protein BB559_002448 [Furculomyces boomerangus]PVZ97435.1 hypothetical protein BB558_006590 [Smittium angustum]PVZ99310.1 hypothetical protein BB558_004674 [Smittium angustum]